MNITTTEAFHAAFIFFGAFAVLNAYFDKWPQCLFALTLSVLMFTVGSLQGLSLLAAGGLCVIWAAVAALYFTVRKTNT